MRNTDDSSRPGLQPERTSLAWDRTGLAFIVAGALLIRAVGSPYPDLRQAPGLVALAFGGFVIAATAHRARRAASGTDSARPPRLMLWVAVVTVQASLAAFFETVS
jgi:uncharacterized membrane protein YidH (DUF202 family)